MDEAARKVLKANKTYINENLILEDGILDELEQEDILTEGMVYKIKAEKTNESKISELLFILPRRGPRAFETFVEATRKHFHFVAEKLEEALNKELDKAENVVRLSSVHNNRHSSDVSMETLSDRSSPDEMTCFSTYDYTQTDGPEPNLNIRLQASDKSFYATNIQQHLNSLYTKLKDHMTSSSLRELSFKSPEPVTFKMINDLIDDLLKSQNKCYSILGQRDKSTSLLSLIHNLMERNKSLETELRNKEEQRNKYAHHITKLENKCRDSNIEVDNMKKDNLKLSAEVKKLEEDILEKLNLKDEVINTMKEELEKLVEELERRTSEYEHRVKNFEAVITKYAKQLNKPVNMFVTGKSPFRDSRRRNDPTPSQSTHLQDHYGLTVDVNPQRATDQRMFEAIPVTNTCKKADDTQNRKQSISSRMAETGNKPNGNTDDKPNGDTGNDQNSNKTDQDSRGQFRKSKMTPHTTSLHPDTSRGKVAGNRTPLEGLQIVNTSSTKPCMPVTSTVNLSPRVKHYLGKPTRNMLVKKH